VKKLRLLAVIVPVVLLVFFTALGVPGLASDRPVDFLLPGMLALAIIANGMVSLGIATAYERYYGVLKRLGATPLGRPALLAGKTLAVVAVEMVQLVVLAGVAVALGWRPAGSPLLAALAAALATVAFAGLGLLLAGTLRAEVTLAVVNGLYLLLLLLGGMVFPLGELPAALEVLARLLPAAALADALGGALAPAADVPFRAWAVLGAWAVVGPNLAALTFRWE
jgi:ABC-2 type transport system permease protein